jgi:AcrR family transcriptional regulator
MRLIDAGEPGSFSMRQLADELGVGVMTLYGYVSNKEELYEGVTALALGEASFAPINSGSWDEQIRLAVRELHGICRRHPNLTTIVLADTKPNPGLYLRRERILSGLRTAGFTPTKALHALGVLTSYALGFALAGGSQALRQLPEGIRDGRRPEFPGLNEVADHYASHLEPAAFEFGLDLLIQGLRADLHDRHDPSGCETQ